MFGDRERDFNKAEVHSINTSKGDTEDVGMFSDNSQTLKSNLNSWKQLS